MQMVVAGGEEQVELAQGAPALRRAVDDQLADRLCTLGAAGLAGEQHLEAAGPQALGEMTGLGALAGPLAAFERDEPTARHWSRLQDAGLPQIR